MKGYQGSLSAYFRAMPAFAFLLSRLPQCGWMLKHSNHIMRMALEQWTTAQCISVYSQQMGYIHDQQRK